MDDQQRTRVPISQHNMSEISGYKMVATLHTPSQASQPALASSTSSAAQGAGHRELPEAHAQSERPARE